MSVFVIQEKEKFMRKTFFYIHLFTILYYHIFRVRSTFCDFVKSAPQYIAFKLNAGLSLKALASL